jgi:hypothetical protein
MTFIEQLQVAELAVASLSLVIALVGIWLNSRR